MAWPVVGQTLMDAVSPRLRPGFVPLPNAHHLRSRARVGPAWNTTLQPSAPQKPAILGYPCAERSSRTIVMIVREVTPGGAGGCRRTLRFAQTLDMGRRAPAPPGVP